MSGSKRKQREGEADHRRLCGDDDDVAYSTVLSPTGTGDNNVFLTPPCFHEDSHFTACFKAREYAGADDNFYQGKSSECFKSMFSLASL